VTNPAPPLTTTELMAAASEVLEPAGFKRIDDFEAEPWPTGNTRIYEDPYSVAAVAAFETWGELSERWLDAQAALAELISAHIGRGDPKAWEGYLVLLTPSALSAEARREVQEIRRDTTFVRKLVGTGEELRRGVDVIEVLRPLLPLEVQASAAEEQEALDLLPTLLARREVPENAVRTLVEAFRQQQPLVESLYHLVQRGDVAR
jgi:hypothetical protein